jgi:hypothetical protein
MARLRRDPEAVLGAKCRLWKAIGYVRFAARELSPRWCAQRRFMQSMEFRSERSQLAQPATTEPETRNPKSET